MVIPKLHYISVGNTVAEHLENIQKACSSGAELVRWGFKKNNVEALKEAREITSHFQTRLLITDDYKLVKELNADGVFLNSATKSAEVARKFLGKYYLIGGDAGHVDDCRKLIDGGVDYIELAPFRTENESENALGLNGYLTIIESLKSDVPIMAKGEITLADVLDLLVSGVYGVALSSEVTDFNEISKFNMTLKGPDFKEEVWKNLQS